MQGLVGLTFLGWQWFCGGFRISGGCENIQFRRRTFLKGPIQRFANMKTLHAAVIASFDEKILIME